MTWHGVACGFSCAVRIRRKISANVLKALNRADVNLFCHDTGLILGGLFFWSVSLLILQTKTSIKNKCAVEAAKISSHRVKIPSSRYLLIKMPLHAKLSFLPHYFWRTKRKLTKTILLWNDTFHVKTGRSAKNTSSILQNMKIDPKTDICPFCTKAFNFYYY